MNLGIKTWHLLITPLSPIHIGTGEDYEPTQYVIDGEALYRFSPEAALRALPEAARQELVRILSGRPTVEMLKQVQSFFKHHTERLIPVCEQVIPVLPAIAAEYQARAGQTAQRESEREIINQLRIARTYGDLAAGRPILPGSSMKGAIRTALLDGINQGRPLPQKIRELLPNKRNLALQQELFQYRTLEQDPMRLIQLSDALDQRPAETFATEIRYAVNRKRQAVLKNGLEVAAQGENLRQVIECIPHLRPRAFTGLLSIQGLGELSGRKVPVKELRWTLEDLAAACNRFYRPILQKELAALRNRGFLDERWAASVEGILKSQEAAFQEGRAFILRVGFHSGAESMTLNGVRSIKINMGRDPKTGETRYENHPTTKTIWLAAREIQQRRDLIPFGWVLIETVPYGQEAAPWPAELEQAFAALRAEEKAWYGQVNARRAELGRRFAELQARAQAEREAAEQQARAAAERAARLEQLSEQGRKIEELRERFAQDKRANRREPGGELANRLVSLLKEAQEDWPAAECQQLAGLAEEIYGFIGWPSGKKKQERRAQIESLRNKR